MRRMWTRPLSKRQLGLLLIAGGVAGIVAVQAVDVLGAGRDGGIGHTQRLALGGMILVALVGLTLLPFGDRPA